MKYKAVWMVFKNNALTERVSKAEPRTLRVLTAGRTERQVCVSIQLKVSKVWGIH